MVVGVHRTTRRVPYLDVEPSVGTLTVGVTALLTRATAVIIATRPGAVLVTRLATLITVGASTTCLVVIGCDSVELGVVTHTATTAISVHIEAVLTTIGEVTRVVGKPNVKGKPMTLRTAVPRADSVPVNVARRQDVRVARVILALMEVTVEVHRLTTTCAA